MESPRPSAALHSAKSKLKAASCASLAAKRLSGNRPTQVAAAFSTNGSSQQDEEAVAAPAATADRSVARSFSERHGKVGFRTSSYSPAVRLEMAWTAITSRDGGSGGRRRHLSSFSPVRIGMRSRAPPTSGSRSRTAAEAAKSLRATRRHLIDPRHSRMMALWDAITTVALFFIALVTPFEVAIPHLPSHAVHSPLTAATTLCTISAITLSDM